MESAKPANHSILTPADRTAMTGNQDWVDELLVGVPAFEPNPHWVCGTRTSPPCPTGEHASEWKPAAGAPPSWGMHERRAHEGELCTCGMPARKIFKNPDGTEVPYCGVPGR